MEESEGGTQFQKKIQNGGDIAGYVEKKTTKKERPPNTSSPGK